MLLLFDLWGERCEKPKWLQTLYLYFHTDQPSHRISISWLINHIYIYSYVTKMISDTERCLQVELQTSTALLRYNSSSCFQTNVKNRYDKHRTPGAWTWQPPSPLLSRLSWEGEGRRPGVQLGGGGKHCRPICNF